VGSAVDERETRARDEIPHRPRDEHVVRSGEREDAGGDVDPDAGDLTAATLDLTGVKTGTDVQAERTHTLTKYERTADGAGGTVERREHPVARELWNLPAEARDLGPGKLIVRLEKLPPMRIA